MDNAPQQTETHNDFLARAEAVLAKYADTYGAEMPNLIAKMEQLAADCVKPEADTAYAELKRMAHDMKGQGAMFGLPDFATVAESLSLLLSKGDHSHPHYHAAMEFHLDVLKRLQSERETPNGPNTANLIDEARHETELVLKPD